MNCLFEERVSDWFGVVVVWLLAILITLIILGILVIGLPTFIAVRACFYMCRWLYKNISMITLVFMLYLLGGVLGALSMYWFYWYFIARICNAMVH